MIEVFDPTTGPYRRWSMAPRLYTLNGKKLGVIWNGRTHGDKIIQNILDLLAKKYKFTVEAFLAKKYIGNIAPQEYFDSLRQKKVDAAIVGVGDWGSCTSASVADAITLETMGIPAAAVCDEKLARTTGRAMAEARGIPGYPIVEIPYEVEPVFSEGITSKEMIEESAKAVVDKVAAILVTQ